MSRARGRLALGLAATAGAAGAYLGWVRDLPVFAVEEVVVSGMRSEERGSVERALTATADGMTTLHVREDRLRQAVAGFAVVRDIQASAQLPHTLRIEVQERRPVAALDAPGAAAPLPVAADGTLLRELGAAGPLPEIRVRDSPTGESVEDPAARALIATAAAAPRPLAAKMARLGRRRGVGVVVALRQGPEIWFGAGREVRAKWSAAARVMAEPSAAGARYVDVRMPELPSAGGLAGGAGQDADPPSTTVE